MVTSWSSAQTSNELLGKWQLVKWTQHGKEKDIIDHFHTDQVFQVFLSNGDFQSINGDQVHKGSWKLSKDNSTLTVTTMLLPVKFKVDYFDKDKRVISYDKIGTFEYVKVPD